MPLSFVHPVHRATHRIGLYLDKLGEPGLTQGEAHILAMLAHSGPAKVAELHRGLAHKRSTLTTKLGMPSSVQTGQAAVAPLPAAGMSKSITLPDWTVDKWDIKTLPYTLAPGLIYSGYVFEFTASRKVEHYILKVILPLILIVMMSWAVFWIDPATSNSQISIAVTSMLTLIAYRFAVDSQLPRLPYMTRLDGLFLTSTLLVFFSLIEVLVTTILDNKQQTERAKKIDRYCRAIFPAIFAVASIAIFA